MKYSKEDFINRELSWLDFNDRVLEEALDKANPLLERLKFLAITASNLDELFMIRIAGIKELANINYGKTDITGLKPSEQHEKILEKVNEMVKKQYNCFKRLISPKLQEEGIEFLIYKDLTSIQKDYLKDYFKENIFPVVTPLALDQSRPFPLLLNKSINLVVELENEENEKVMSFVQIPSILQRYFEIGREKGSKFILLEEIIRENLSEFFKGFRILKSGLFRITRNSDLTIDEEDAEDLLIEIENSIKKRKWGFPVRLELEKGIDLSLKEFLLKSFYVQSSEVFEVNGPLDFTFLMKFSFIDGYDKLKFKKLKPIEPVKLYKKEDIFEEIKKNDIFLHHPFESFDPVINFVKKAALDPNVLAIKQVLYRVSGDSPIVKALIKAAEKGKQVTVLVELKARFDEENNIQWAKRLEKAGCHVVYGLVGLKTHAKILLVVRKEEDGIKRYLHLGTGNYNDSTAKLYTDAGIFTCRSDYAADASALFNVLTGYSKPTEWKKLIVAPFSMRDRFKKLIDNEKENAINGIPARIIAKINSLVDVEIIEKLYDASKAGVKIELIVRGISCLRAGVKGLSENISLRSIVGRFLEHSRIFYFENAGDSKIYMSSADWMTRNLSRRIELMFPIEDEKIKDRIMKILDIYLNDTEKSRVLIEDNTYKRVDKRGKAHLNAQNYFIEESFEEIKKIKEELG